MTQHTEFEEIVHAIRRGGIDALVVSGKEGDQVVVLQDSEHPYRVLVDNFSEGAATLDAEGNILYANDRLAEILGAPREQLIGAQLLECLPSARCDDLARLIRKGTAGEVVLRSGGDGQRTIRFTLGPQKVKGSKEIHFCLVATELTAMVKVTEELKLTEQSLGEVSARLLSLQDEERRRIARDLHDITGQSLAVQSMMLQNLLDREGELDSEARKLVSECAAINGRITEEVRTLSYLLHPPLIDELGLGPAVKWYIDGFSRRSGMEVLVDVESDFPRMSAEAEIALFRILQEGLTNVHRHSGSSRVQVNLRRRDDEIALEIRDFGKGVRPEVLKSNATKALLGVGILGMRERVRQLSGSLEIVSHENQGTLVAVHLPLHCGQVGAGGASAARNVETSSQKQPRKSKAAKSGR
ncbi:MAG: ATP-binding protein [Candidatus Acidiferrales bacterium]